MQIFSFFLFVYLSNFFCSLGHQVMSVLKYSNRDSQCTVWCDHSYLHSWNYVSMMTLNFGFSPGFERDTVLTLLEVMAASLVNFFAPNWYCRLVDELPTSTAKFILANGDRMDQKLLSSKRHEKHYLSPDLARAPNAHMTYQRYLLLLFFDSFVHYLPSLVR